MVDIIKAKTKMDTPNYIEVGLSFLLQVFCSIVLGLILILCAPFILPVYGIGWIAHKCGFEGIG